MRVSDRAPARWIPVRRQAAAEFSSPAEAEPAFRANAPHLEGMNEQQISAIVAPIAPMKVLAGPGSGKTRVLVGRVTHLINELGVPPSHILCITFTNKAAREMRERLIASVGEDNARQITAGTFHSVASRMLRKHVHLLDGYGRGNDFVIYDEADTKSIIRKILVDVFMEDKKKVDPSLAKSRISAAKSAVDACVGMDGRRMMRALCETRPNLKRDPYTRDQFPRLYDEYEANLRSSNALDFDDLLSAAVALLRTSEEARMFYTQKWRHVLVDEFQDTSLSQYELIRTLAAESARVFVVGDVDQAIYSWRGAEVANIRTKFDSDFAGAGTVLLTKNYRSTATIVKAAQAVIGESRDRSPLELDAVQPGGKDVAVVATEDEVEEADFAAREAARAARNGVPLKDIAVLYRTHSQSRPLEEAFIRAGVPHVVVGDTAFYTRKEIKDLVAYLRVLFNSRDTVSLQRIINTPPRKIGPGTMQKLETWAASLPWIDGMPQPLGMALLDRTWSSPDQEDILPSAVDMGLGAAAYKAVSGFVSVMRDLGESMEVSDPGALTEELSVEAAGGGVHSRRGAARRRRGYRVLHPQGDQGPGGVPPRAVQLARYRQFAADHQHAAEEDWPGDDAEAGDVGGFVTVDRRHAAAARHGAPGPHVVLTRPGRHTSVRGGHGPRRGCVQSRERLRVGDAGPRRIDGGVRPGRAHRGARS